MAESTRYQVFSFKRQWEHERKRPKTRRTLLRCLSRSVTIGEASPEAQRYKAKSKILAVFIRRRL